MTSERTAVPVFVLMALAVVPQCQGAAPDEEPVVLPGGTSLSVVEFDRHVAGLLGRLGCNSAACHGSFQGKGGFKLSLFGQSPEKDHQAITADAHSPRVDCDAPDESLLLLKASGRARHGGGTRFRPDSWEYRLMRRWIASGARRDTARGTVRQLTVEPREIPPLAQGESAGIKVWARFGNGDKEDVTAFTEYRTGDESVAECDSTGRITARAAGAASIVAAYRGTFVSVAVPVLYSQVGESLVIAPAANFIDDEINARLAQLRISVSPRADDAAFLRRATLDVLGIVPAPDEVRAFVSSSDPEKRTKLIDALLASPRRAALWAARMCDITHCNIDTMEGPEELRPKRARQWHDWFRKRFEENTRYHEIVEGILCATSRENQPIEEWIDAEAARQESARKDYDATYRARPSLDLFWRRVTPQGPFAVEDFAELTATAFLGLRLHCARCHQHPFDRWTQSDFAGYANIFARVEFGSSTALRTAMNARLELRRQARALGSSQPELPRLQEAYLAPKPRPLADAAEAGGALPKAPGGPVFADSDDARREFFRWLIQPDNPYFAKSFVNRLWAKYFGTGLVEPVDSLSPANPPAHPRLFDRLAAEFVQSGYDIRHMERLILSSQTYQRSSNPAGNNAADRNNMARAPVRPLIAEILLDSLNAALETVQDFGSDVPAGSQAIELAPNRFSTPAVNEMFRVLGRGDRKSLCDCDRAATPSVRGSLYVMSDPRVVAKVREGRLARLLREEKTDSEIIDQFCLATLSRRADDEERQYLLQYVAGSTDRAAALADIVWALINTREFVTNH